MSLYEMQRSSPRGTDGRLPTASNGQTEAALRSSTVSRRETPENVDEDQWGRRRATDETSSSPEREGTPGFTVAAVAVSALLAVLFARYRD